MAFIISTSVKSNMAHHSGLFDAICPVLYQGCNLFANAVILKSMSTATRVVISIWLFSAFIITQLFCNDLLSAYINVKYVPIVNTLDDIVNDKQMLVLSESIGTLEWLSSMESKYKNTLITLADRHRWYESRLNSSLSFEALYDSQIFDDMANGRAAFLFNSIVMEIFIISTRHDKHRYAVSKHKYFKLNFNYIVAKNATYGQQLISM